MYYYTLLSILNSSKLIQIYNVSEYNVAYNILYVRGGQLKETREQHKNNEKVLNHHKHAPAIKYSKTKINFRNDIFILKKEQ